MKKNNKIVETTAKSYSTPEFKETAKKVFANLQNELQSVNSSQFKIAFNLWWIYQTEAYKLDNSQNIYIFSEKYFGLCRGSCNNYLNVAERFAKKIGQNPPTEIEEKFKDFKFSQLLLMKNLSDKQIDKLSPVMSTREMKRKIAEMNSLAKLSNAQAQAQAQEIKVEAVEIKRSVLYTATSVKDYENNLEKILEKVKKAFKENNGEIEIAYIRKISQSSDA